MISIDANIQTHSNQLSVALCSLPFWDYLSNWFHPSSQLITNHKSFSWRKRYIPCWGWDELCPVSPDKSSSPLSLYYTRQKLSLQYMVSFAEAFMSGFWLAGIILLYDPFHSFMCCVTYGIHYFTIHGYLNPNYSIKYESHVGSFECFQWIIHYTKNGFWI